jgi:hypothetical protein
VNWKYVSLLLVLAAETTLGHGLAYGENKIEIAGGAHALDVDYLEVTPGEK